MTVDAVLLRVPEEIAEVLDDMEGDTVELIRNGADLLARLDRDPGAGDGDPATAVGDALFYRARVTLARLEVADLADEVGELELEILGERSAPPESVLETPGACITLAVPAVEAAGGGALEHLECLCYGIAIQRQQTLPVARAVAHSEFAAAKFALFEMHKARESLSFQRAGLLGRRDAARRRRHSDAPVPE